MNPEMRTIFSVHVGKGEVFLIPELCDQVVSQVLLRSGVKAPAVARAVRKDRRTINRYENGQTMPDLRTTVEILHHLGYDLIIKRR